MQRATRTFRRAMRHAVAVQAAATRTSALVSTVATTVEGLRARVERRASEGVGFSMLSGHGYELSVRTLEVRPPAPGALAAIARDWWRGLVGCATTKVEERRFLSTRE